MALYVITYFPGEEKKESDKLLKCLEKVEMFIAIKIQKIYEPNFLIQQ